MHPATSPPLHRGYECRRSNPAQLSPGTPGLIQANCFRITFGPPEYRQTQRLPPLLPPGAPEDAQPTKVARSRTGISGIPNLAQNDFELAPYPRRRISPRNPHFAPVRRFNDAPSCGSRSVFLAPGSDLPHSPGTPAHRVAPTGPLGRTPPGYRGTERGPGVTPRGQSIGPPEHRGSTE